MDGRELSGMLNYTGMEKDARKLAVRDKMASVEDIAIMNIEEVCDLIAKKYEVVMNEGECVLLIPKDRMQEFNKMAVYIER